MLAFVDAPKFMRVFRLEQTDDGGVRRVRIGRLMKETREFRADEGVSINGEEQAQIGGFAETMKDADAHLLRADALRFPEFARRAAEYYVNRATDVEKQMIATAALEITRAIRKASKVEEAA
jgi:hypothetical protein